MKLLYKPFGMILSAIYSFTGNYGLSIILFALVAKLITLPLTIKQTKSTQALKIITPEAEKIKEKYRNNKNKQAEETMKLYEKYNYNPMSGCLPLLIQLPIIIGLFGVIRMPETYVFHNIGIENVSMAFLWVKDLSQSAMEVFRAEGFKSVNTYLAMILPALNVISMWIQQRQTMKDNPQQAETMGMMNNMLVIMIAYSSMIFTAGLTLYWLAQTVFQLLQTKLLEVLFPFKLPEAGGQVIKTTKEGSKK